MTVKHYEFKPNEIEKIEKRFGEDFFVKVSKDIHTYAEQWALTALQLIPSYSANIVFKGYCETYGHVVLKLGPPSSGGIKTEYYTLRQYKGRRFCKVFDADLENGVLLEECLQPGIPLRDEGSLEQRLAVFCALYKGLHIAPEEPELFPTYTQWVDRITEYMSKREDCKELYRYMKKAKDIHRSVTALYSQRMLLHGDLHHDNILLGAEGKYSIIDPKGVIGDPVLDVPRFILNEFEDEITPELYNKIGEILSFLEKNLAIPNDILRKCLFVETVMGLCWCAEDGSTPEEYVSLIKTAAFAEAILDG